MTPKIEVTVIAKPRDDGASVHILDLGEHVLQCRARPAECLAVPQHRTALATCPLCISQHDAKKAAA